MELGTYDGTWEMVVIGTGPGPKNVLARRVEDGKKLVVAYATWKHRMVRAQNVYSAPTHTERREVAVDLQTSIIQVAVRNTRGGKQVFDVSCGDGKTRQVWDAGLANAINAYAGSGATITIRFTQKQNGQYLNESINAFAPPGQALPPEQAGGGIGGGGGGPRGGGRGGMSPQDKKRIARMGAQGSAAVLVAALFQGAGPEAYDEAMGLFDKTVVKLYKQAVNNGGEIEAQAEGGATVLQPGATVGEQQAATNVLPQGATPEQVAATVPGVVVGAQALQPGGATDAAAAQDVAAQASAEAGDDNIEWD